MFRKRSGKKRPRPNTDSFLSKLSETDINSPDTNSVNLTELSSLNASRKVNFKGDRTETAEKVLNQETDVSGSFLKEEQVESLVNELNKETHKSSENNRKGDVKDKIEVKKLPFGPRKAPSHLRVTSRFDYQPDICKDYKETGFCGYGDACKFLHDRSDYKSGWEIEREWELEQRKKKQKLLLQGKSKLVNTSKDNLNETHVMDNVSRCMICRNEYNNPVQTTCGHVFCQTCALGRYTSQNIPTCAECGKSTNGIFNNYSKKTTKA